MTADESLTAASPTPPTAPVRVALVITGLAVGGAEKCLTQIALGLDRTRYLPHVISLQPRPALPKDRLVRELETAGVTIDFLNARRIAAWPLIVGRLWTILRRRKIQVVQSFLYHANVTGVVAARLAGIRPVHVGIRVAEPSLTRRRIEQYTYALAQSLIYVSKSVRRYYRDDRPYRLGFPFVIANGIEVERYQQAAPADLSSIGLSAETPVIASVGRLHEQKGLDWFLRALPPLLEQHPTHHVILVGDGPQRQQLIQLAESLALNSRVHFLGWRDDIPGILRRAELLVLPSRYEGMPNVVLEAMAAGTSVVSTRVQGVAELLGPHASELTVDYGDSPALVTRISTLLNDAERRQTIATALLARAHDRFSWPTKVAAYEALWEQS